MNLLARKVLTLRRLGREYLRSDVRLVRNNPFAGGCESRLAASHLIIRADW
jgi:hypothetical protein